MTLEEELEIYYHKNLQDITLNEKLDYIKTLFIQENENLQVEYRRKTDIINQKYKEIIEETINKK